MGLDMYAFSLERSPTFTTTHDVLNYRIPADGKELPHGPIALGTDPQMLEELSELLGFDIRAEMGLGQPAAFSPTLDAGSMFLDSKYVLPGSTLLHRWRKHPDFHGWMHRRWRGMPWHRGANGEFNSCTRLPLSTVDLDNLENAVRTDQLPRTTGQFFHESSGTEQQDDLAFIAAARKELAAGKFVYYTSWW